MGDQYIGEIRVFPGNYAPVGWALCNGQLMAISQNAALFSILGTAYGGDGRTNFALPDLRGRTPLHSATATPGASRGEDAHTLTDKEMPLHTHIPVASTVTVGVASPSGARWGSGGASPLYNQDQPNTPMHPTAIADAGAGAAHTNLQPYLVLNFCIAVQGIFPSRN